ncbi:MAG: hypothetical protein AAGF46_09325 [Pseudomonadota bacterium]
MNRLSVAILAVVLTTSSSVLAFQEMGPPAVSSAPAYELVPQGAPPVAQIAPDDSTSVVIPGFGDVGALPKLDFGLELLYSEDDLDPAPGTTSNFGGNSDVDDSDITIKGRIRHQF